jgi:hypothetical protein
MIGQAAHTTKGSVTHLEVSFGCCLFSCQFAVVAERHPIFGARCHFDISDIPHGLEPSKNLFTFVLAGKTKHKNPVLSALNNSSDNMSTSLLAENVGTEVESKNKTNRKTSWSEIIWFSTQDFKGTLESYHSIVCRIEFGSSHTAADRASHAHCQTCSRRSLHGLGDVEKRARPFKSLRLSPLTKAKSV